MPVMTRIMPSRTPGPAQGTVSGSKSGYACHVMPDRVEAVEAAGGAAPIASETGAQAGRVPPARRKTPHYRAVSAAEAEELFVKRLRGEEARIEGGLDGPGVEKNAKTQYEDTRMESRDCPEYVGPQTMQTPVVGVVTPLQTYQPDPAQARLADLAGRRVEPGKAVVWLTDRARLQMSIEGAGTYSLPAIDVIPSMFGVLVVLPCGDNDTTFLPNPGVAVRIQFKGASWNCYYPGIAGEFKELGIMVLAFVDSSSRTNEEAGNGKA